MAVKLTTQDVINKLKEKGTNIQLVGEYLGSSIIHTFQCKEGHQFNVRADHVLHSGKLCPTCNSNKITTEIVHERLIKQDRGIRLVGEFNGSVDNKHTFICKNDHTWSATVYDVTNEKRPTGCPTCSNKLPLTDEIITKRLEGRNITMIGKFKGTGAESHDFKCNTCEYTWSTKLSNVLSGKGCIVCAGKKAYTLDDVTSKLEGRNITLISEFTGGINKNYKFKCTKPDCNHEWETTLNSVIGKQKTGCGMCVSKVPLTTKILQERLLIQGKGIELVNEYNPKNDKQEFKCIENHTWFAKQYHVLDGSGCPTCAGNKAYTLETFNKKIEGRNLKLISEDFKGLQRKHKFECIDCEDIWETTGASVLNGTGCPSCADYGFHPDRESEFYIYKLKNINNIEVIGFGITNDFKMRHRDHCLTFKKNDIEYEIIKVFKFKSGFEVRKIESILKRNNDIINFGILGFRSECLPLSYLHFILEVASIYSEK